MVFAGDRLEFGEEEALGVGGGEGAAEQAAIETNAKYNFIRNQQQNANGGKVPLIPGETQPSLPELLGPVDAIFDRAALVAAFNAEGVVGGAGYLPRPMYRYPVFLNHNFFGGAWPVRDSGLTKMDYRAVSCPVAEAILTDCMTLRITEAMTDAYVEKVGRAFNTVIKRLAR